MYFIIIYLLPFGDDVSSLPPIRNKYTPMNEYKKNRKKNKNKKHN